MKQCVCCFTVKPEDTVLDAMKVIDYNKKGFCIVIDDEEHVLGVITDGDIRRSFISGKSLEDKLEDIYTKNCKTVLNEDSMEDVMTLFKNDKVNFLPIVDNCRKLVNLITKRQLHVILLSGNHVDLDYNFLGLDENVIDYEVFPKPWGFYKTTVLNDYHQAKVISVKPGCRLSLQSHNHREEHWIIVNGVGEVQIDDSVLPVYRGSSVFIPRGARHRVVNTDKREALVMAEVQIGDYLGEDDITRYEDDYGRANV